MERDSAANIEIIPEAVWRAWWVRQILSDAAILALTTALVIVVAYDFVAVALVAVALTFRASGAYLLHRAYGRQPHIEVVEAVVVAPDEDGAT